MKYILTILAFISVNIAQGQTTLLHENFNTNGTPSYNVLNWPETYDTPWKYYTRTDGSNISINYAGNNGDFFAFRDIDSLFSVSYFYGTRLDFNINIAGYDYLDISGMFASLDSLNFYSFASPTVSVRVISMGLYEDVFFFTSRPRLSSTGTVLGYELKEVSDLNNPIDLSGTFSNFSKRISIPSNLGATNITLRIDISGFVNTQNDFAFDELMVVGDTLLPCTTPTPPSNLTLYNMEDEFHQLVSFDTSSADDYIVFRSEIGPITAAPVDGVVYYDNSSGPGNSHCVGTFSGEDSIFSSTIPSTDYFYSVYAVNDFCSGAPKYSSTGISGSLRTKPEKPSYMIVNCLGIDNVEYMIGTICDGSNCDGLVLVASEGLPPEDPTVDFNLLPAANSDYGLAGNIGSHSKLIFASNVNTSGSHDYNITGLTTGNTVYVNAYTFQDSTNTYYSFPYKDTLDIIVYSPELYSINPMPYSAEIRYDANSYAYLSCYPDEYLVVLSENPFSGIKPSGNGNQYNPNSKFGEGSSFDGGYIVQKDNMTIGILINGLEFNTTYYYQVFSRIDTFWSEPLISSFTTDTIYPTELHQGDLLFAGVASYGIDSTGLCGSTGDSLERYDFVCLEEIRPGTEIEITDCGWEKANSGYYGSNEGLWTFEYVGGSNIPIGQPFTLYAGNILDASVLNESNNWRSKNTLSTISNDLDLNVGGDQLLVTQGMSWNLIGTDQLECTGGKYLTGISTTGIWVASNTDASSNLPKDLHCASVAVQGNTDFINYNGPSTSVSSPELFSLLTNTQYWASSADCNSYSTNTLTYSILNDTAKGKYIWHGGTIGDENSWYNCQNWQPSKVPGENDSVIVDGLLSNYNLVLNDSADFASIYENEAYANTILIRNNGVIESKSNNAATINIENLLMYSNSLGTLDLDDQDSSTSDATIIISGDFIIQPNSLQSGNSEFHFVGSNIQEVQIDDELSKVVMQKSDSSIILLDTLTIKDSLIYNDGYIEGDSFPVVFNDDAEAVNHSTESFTIGTVIKKGNDAFTFPTGAPNLYKPVTISAPSLATDVFSVTYNDTCHFPNSTSSFPNFSTYSPYEYWDIDRLIGNSAIDIKFYWDSYSNVYDPVLSHPIGIAHLDLASNHWFDVTPNNINIADQEITVYAVNSFSPFTFWTYFGNFFTNLNNLNISSNNLNDKILLNWEADLIGDYIIERSLDLNLFEEIAHYSSQISGQYMDQFISTSDQFYRLKHLQNGIEKYSKVILVKNFNQEKISVYPNPGTDIVNIQLDDRKTHLNVYDMQSRLIYSAYSSGLTPINTSDWHPGVYIIQAYGSNRVLWQKK